MDCQIRWQFRQRHMERPMLYRLGVEQQKFGKALARRP
jgi:hypothetical protein